MIASKTNRHEIGILDFVRTHPSESTGWPSGDWYFFFLSNFVKIVRFSACGAGFVAFGIVAFFFVLVAGTGARVASVSNVGFVSALLFGTLELIA